MPRRLWNGLSQAMAAAIIVMGCGVGGALAFSPSGGADGGGSSSGSSSGGGGGDDRGDDGRSSSGGAVDPIRVSPDGRTVCREGWFYNLDLKICQWLGNVTLNDGELYEQGRALALAGHYAQALDLFDAIVDKDDAMVLTMIGYATRKLGNLAEGIAIYRQALALEPNNLNTHEYLGEGYLDAGRIDLAEAELDTLEQLCGVDCPQYRALAGVIAGDALWN